MSPIKQLTENPILALVAALLIAAIGIIGAMNQSSLNDIKSNQVNAENRMWAKLDRVVNLMEVGRSELQAQIKDIQKLGMCHDRELAEIRERITGHLMRDEPDVNRKTKK